VDPLHAAYRGGVPWGEPEDESEDDAIFWQPPDFRPEDARRMGLTRAVPDGALLDFAGALDPSKPKHRVTAWVMLGVFCFPVLMYVLNLIWMFRP
jgi:hypothetical protein